MEAVLVPGDSNIVRCPLLVIGCGVAGLTVALKSADHCGVVLVSKGNEFDSNSSLAQGGIAVALNPEDSTYSHMMDTLETGMGLSSRKAVETLVNEGVIRVRELVRLGVDFDREDGRLAFAREGGHSRRRIVHVGDSTGREVVRILLEKVLANPRVRFVRGWKVVQLLVSDGQCHGAVAVDGDGKPTALLANATVLATGGIGQLYSITTNSHVATGDGIALALRAGAEIVDMEFIQFHPTALYEGRGSGPAFLISEAVRGEGALLLNAKGIRFMSEYHPMGELAPRDVVARAILSETERTGKEYVFLDMRHIDPEFLRRRFPEIHSGCKHRGIDVTKELVPVMPAAHYLMGGVRVGLDGESSVKRLFVCGESSCTGVHGANRLASNSLLEALVFGARTSEAIISRYLGDSGEDIQPRAVLLAKDGIARWNGINHNVGEQWSGTLMDIQSRLKEAMMLYAGLVRTATGLEELRRIISRLKSELMKGMKDGTSPVNALEVENELEVGDLIARFAETREESRGGHYRADFPEMSERWACHLSLVDGGMREVKEWE